MLSSESYPDNLSDQMKSTEAADVKSIFGSSLRTLFNRIFRRQSKVVHSGTTPVDLQFFCFQCTRNNEVNDPRIQPNFSETVSSIPMSSWDNGFSVSHHDSLFPAYATRHLSEDFPIENQCHETSCQQKITMSFAHPMPMYTARLLRCPHCLQVAPESEYCQPILEPRNSDNLVQSHSRQTIGDKLNVNLEMTDSINQLRHGSLMTDSGISIGSEKVSHAQFYGTQFDQGTPCMQHSIPTLFHLSSDPPPSPAPEPVSLMIPHKQQTVGAVSNSTESISFSMPLKHVEPDDESLLNENQDSEFTSSFLQKDALDYIVDVVDTLVSDKSPTCLSSSISLGDVFSCKAICDAFMSEQRTQLIQSRTKAQIESLLRFSSGSRVDRNNCDLLPIDNSCFRDLHNELAILEDAKCVINRQIEEVKKQYARRMRGKISLPTVDKSQQDWNKTVWSDVYESPSKSHFSKERSYSLNDVRFGEFYNNLLSY